jgi:general secretion pathway protein L
VRETLYLRLRGGAPDQPVAFRIDGSAAGGARIGSLSDALALASGRRLVVFVPAESVRLMTVHLPVRQPAKALRAVPFALEDQLAEDVDTLHFALGTRQPDGHYPVATVSRDNMQGWLLPLRERGLRADALVPETLCLPWHDDGRWVVLAESDRLLVRSGAYSGFTCAPADLPLFLSLAESAPEALRVIAPLGTEADYDIWGIPVELTVGEPTALDALIRHWQATASINLLQGQFAPHHDLQRLWLPWRRAAVLGIAALLLGMSHAATELWQLNRELQQLETANLERFQELFPDQTRADRHNLELHVAQQRRVLAGGGEEAGLLMLLQHLASAMSATPGLTLRNVQYRESALYLNLTAGELEVLENLRNWFERQPHVLLDVESANASAEGVQIRVKVTRA